MAQKRIDKLRVISVNSLLSLAEMTNEYDIGHEDILAVIGSSGPSIDPVVDLMSRLVAGSRLEERELPQNPQEDEAVQPG